MRIIINIIFYIIFIININIVNINIVIIQVILITFINIIISNILTLLINFRLAIIVFSTFLWENSFYHKNQSEGRLEIDYSAPWAMFLYKKLRLLCKYVFYCPWNVNLELWYNHAIQYMLQSEAMYSRNRWCNHMAPCTPSQFV